MIRNFLRELYDALPDAPRTALRNYWYTRRERHFTLCADVEARYVAEHQANAAHYQKQAALMRAQRNAVSVRRLRPSELPTLKRT